MLFLLTAVDASNRVVTLDMEASDEAGVRQIAKRRGYSVLTAREKGVHRFLARRTKKYFPTTLFSIELLTLLDAGLNVVEALQALSEKESKEEHRTVLTGLLDALHRGESLSQSLEGFPQMFSALYVATIRSSERTGDIKQALARYIAYEEEFERVRKKLFAALLYPAILSIVGVLVLGFLTFYVVPRFAQVYEEASIELPLFSALLLALGRTIEQNGIVAALLLAGLLGGGAYALSRERVRAALLEQLYRNSSAGARMRTYQLGRFYRTVAMLFSAGIPALKAFEMVCDLLPPNMRIQLGAALALIKEGKPMSIALTSAGLATPVATRMLAVGERSGRMGDMMDRIARFCDEETARFIDAFTRVFEPLLMALLGLAVGVVVLLMYMPIFELAGSIR